MEIYLVLIKRGEIMVRGTTPELIFTLPFEVSSIQKLWITFSQKNSEIFTLEKEVCTLDGTEVRVSLTQEQTLQFSSNCILEIQMRVLTLDNVALASNIIRTSVQKILKGGVI